MTDGPGDAHRSARPIRLMLIEPRALLGAAVREILSREPDIEVVAAVRSPTDALPVVVEVSPDVIVISGQVAEATTFEATRRLRKQAPRSAVVVLGGEDDDASMVEAVQIGAVARIAEVAAPDELVETIRDVAHGSRPLTDELQARPELLDRVLDSIQETLLADREPDNPLTEREREVLSMVALGMRNKEIGDRLGISSQTVKNHISAVLHKLGVQNRTRAVTYAARHGWLGLDEEPGRFD
jgi:DNA-binding NarL/FixJ family response regulator